LGHAECYRLLEATGLKYKTGFQALKEIKSHQRKTLAFMVLPKELKESFEIKLSIPISRNST